jgi:TRAP-type C4-dicarboxylate transport system permease small subunit
MTINPFIILLIPLWVYIFLFGIRVIRDSEVSLNYYLGFSSRKRTKALKGIPAKFFGYSTLIGGLLVTIALISTLFSNSNPLEAGLLYVTLCPLGIVFNILGLVIGFSLSRHDT